MCYKQAQEEQIQRTKSRERHKFYKAIKWHKFYGRNHIAKSAMFPNIWLTCHKIPYKMPEKLKNHMKLTSMMNPMRLQLQIRSLRKLRCQTRLHEYGKHDHGI
jgi:hypothetical protein